MSENLVRIGFLGSFCPEPWAVLEVSKECIVLAGGGDLFQQQWWSEVRDSVPTKLAQRGVSLEEWSSTWDCVHDLMLQAQ